MRRTARSRTAIPTCCSLQETVNAFQSRRPSPFSDWAACCSAGADARKRKLSSQDLKRAFLGGPFSLCSGFRVQVALPLLIELGARRGKLRPWLRVEDTPG